MNEAWNKISPELKTSHPELAPLYVNGQRTGDTKPFTDALEEIGKRVAAVPVIKSVDRGDVVDIYENGVKVRTERRAFLREHKRVLAKKVSMRLSIM